jgi:geranylgeranyl diphosphate synthase type II
MGASSHKAEAEALSLDAAAELIETYLQQRLADQDLPANLLEAIEYALLAGGKRLRPALVLQCCEMVGGEREPAMPAAAAVELVHTFSLVHDDLPAMDDDDLRRGQPTLHKHTSEAMAILAGDAMLVLAFRLISYRAEAGQAGRLTAELADASTAMINGQVYDTLASDDGLSERQRLERIHRNKTAALIRGACRMGGVAAGGDGLALRCLSDYGEAIGLMFQAVDDLLDVTQSTSAMGKTTQKDHAQGKLTYPGLIGVEATRHEIERLRQAAHDALAPFGERAAGLARLCDYLAQRQR